MKYSYNGTEVIANSKKEAITKIIASEHSRILKSRIKRWIPASYKVKDIDLDSFEIRHPTCKNIVATEDYSALLDELRRFSKTSKFELSKGKESIIVTVLPLSNETKVTAFNKDTIRENTKLFYEDMNKGEFIYNYRIDDKFQDFIDNTLEDEIHDVIRSDKNLITRCIENRVKNYSIVWSALVQIFEDVRKRWNLKSTVTNELIKNWFAYNDTDYKTSLKKIVDNLTEFREELRKSEGNRVVSSANLFKEGIINMKQYAYNGELITASSKKEAIQKIIATRTDTKFKKLTEKDIPKDEERGKKTSYRTVSIGGKTWMAENLAYDDGGKGIFYNPKNKEYYYTWDAAKRVAKKLGWKLPSDKDWNKACEACGGIKVNEWNDYEKCSLKKKLNIKLAGYCLDGSCHTVGSYGLFWSVSELSNAYAWYRYFATSASVTRDSRNKSDGFSLRLVK